MQLPSLCLSSDKSVDIQHHQTGGWEREGGGYSIRPQLLHIPSSLQGKEVLVKGSNPRKEGHKCLLNEHTATGPVLEEQFTHFIEVPHHELLTGLAGHCLGKEGRRGEGGGEEGGGVEGGGEKGGGVERGRRPACTDLWTYLVLDSLPSCIPLSKPREPPYRCLAQTGLRVAWGNGVPEWDNPHTFM